MMRNIVRRSLGVLSLVALVGTAACSGGVLEPQPRDAAQPVATGWSGSRLGLDISPADSTPLPEVQSGGYMVSVGVTDDTTQTDTTPTYP